MNRQAPRNTLRTGIKLLAALVVGTLAQSAMAQEFKLRFATFETISRSVTLPSAVTSAPAITAAVEPLLAPIDPSPGVRLVGVSGSNLGAPIEQLSLFGDESTPTPEAWNSASSALDDIRNRFGTAAIGPASTMRGGSLKPVRRGEQQWGPDQPGTAGAP